jgi:hypothetical protein
MPWIAMGAGTPILAVHALSPARDGIMPWMAPVLSASHQDDQRHGPLSDNRRAVIPLWPSETEPVIRRHLAT